MHPIGVLEAHILISPRGDHRRVNERSSMREQSLCGGLQVGDLQRKADLAANSVANFDLIHGLGLPFVKNLESGLSHIKD